MSERQEAGSGRKGEEHEKTHMAEIRRSNSQYSTCFYNAWSIQRDGYQ